MEPMGKLYILGIFLFTNFVLFSQVQQLEPTQVVAKSDTTIIDVLPNGNKFVPHLAIQGEDLVSISTSYGVPFWAVEKFNPGLTTENVSPGMWVKIPLQNRRVYKYITELAALDTLQKVYYRVKKGETLYGIAKRNFGTEIELIKAYNYMDNYELAVDQLIHVAYIPKFDWDPIITFEEYDPIMEDESLQNEFVSKGADKKILNERGAATISVNDMGDSSLFALHRTAARGSVIKISNPDTGFSVHTRVLGKIPPTQYQKHIKVVVSPKVAELLGGINKEFFVTLQYHK